MIRAFIILILLSVPVAAQEARIVEKLADGSFIVAIGAIEYRALPPTKVAELAKQKIDLDAAQKVNTELNVQIKEAVLQRDLAQAREALQSQKVDSLQADFNRAREDASRFQSLFMSERELRREASSFVPHGNKTKFDKFLALFDNKTVQFTIKGLLPIVQTWRCQ